MVRVQINRRNRLGQTRGINSMRVKRVLNEMHTAVVSLPYKPAGTIAASQNTMQIFRVTTTDLFNWAPRIGSTLKYNNAEVKSMAVTSVPTASLSTVGTHAIWAVFDQQPIEFVGSEDESENTALIEQTIAEMRQTGQYRIGSAISKFNAPLMIPPNIRKFNFQDVEAVEPSADAYNATTVAQVIRIYPTDVAPITSVEIKVQYSGLAKIGQAPDPGPAPAIYDKQYLAGDISIQWLKQTYHGLKQNLPIRQMDKIFWEPTLFVVVHDAGNHKMLKWTSESDVTLSGSWDTILFPSRHAGGKLNSELNEICCYEISDPRLDDLEKYYAHAPRENWEFEPDNIAAGLYIRFAGAKPVGERSADEILSTVVSNHGLNVNLGMVQGGIDGSKY